MMNSLLAGAPLTVEFRLLVYFTLGLAVILVVPRLFERISLPGLLGLILAGALLGPPGAGLVKANDNILGFFAEIGKLMLMFLIGLEINLDQFNKARLKAITFGALTFAAPMALAALLARHHGYSWHSSILIGSLLASHTLLAFPLLEKAGLAGGQPAAITVGATIFTDIAALLTLAICVSIHTTGFSERQIAIQVAELAVYVVVVVLGLSAVARRLVARFRHSDDAILIAVLLVMAVASIGAVLIRMEDIIGAFLAGLAVNSFTRSSRARNNLRTIGEAMFIPAFFFSIGTQLSIGPLAAQTAGNPSLVVGLLVALLVGKFVAAAVAASLFGHTGSERNLMWSLTLPQVAATLAAAFVAFEVKNSNGARLIDEPVLAAVILLMLATTILGPMLTLRFVRRLSMPAR